MALSSNLYGLKVQTLDKIYAQTAAQKVAEWPSYVNFRNVTQNPHFQKKCKEETKRSFSKIAQKEVSLQGANSTLAQMSLSSKLHPLIIQRLKKILAQKAAPKLPEWPSYGNFCKVTQNPHFLKKCKGRTKANFSNIAQKVALV